MKVYLTRAENPTTCKILLSMPYKDINLDFTFTCLVFQSVNYVSCTTMDI